MERDTNGMDLLGILMRCTRVEQVYRHDCELTGAFLPCDHCVHCQDANDGLNASTLFNASTFNLQVRLLHRLALGLLRSGDSKFQTVHHFPSQCSHQVLISNFHFVHC